jgi:hypothetical protein
MRVLDDDYLRQVVRASNRNPECTLDVRCGLLDRFDLVSTLAQLLARAGIPACVKLGRLHVSDDLVTLAKQWLSTAVCLRLPLTPAEMETWTRHTAVSLVSFEDCLNRRVVLRGSSTCVRILPINRDGRVSRTRHCAALVSFGSRTTLVHVSDLPIAASIASALSLVTTAVADISNNHRTSGMSHEAALLATVARVLAGKRPRPKRAWLRTYGAAMARQRRARTSNAGVARALRHLESSLSKQVLSNFPDGLEMEHLPPPRPVSLPQYTPLASRIAAAITARAAARQVSDRVNIVAYNTVTAQWAGFSTCGVLPNVPLLTTVSLSQRAEHVDLEMGLFLWVSEPTEAVVTACCIPVQQHESPTAVCVAATPCSDVHWVCVQDHGFPGGATQLNFAARARTHAVC